MTRPLAFALLTALTLPFGLAACAQVAAQALPEGPIPTQALVHVETNSPAPIPSSALVVTVNDRTVALDGWTQVEPASAQVALLIDDGLRMSVGRELGNLRDFVRTLPSGVEVLIGYMQHGTVIVAQPFTTDHTLAASTLRLPQGIAGVSASPYMCLSDFVTHWPTESTSGARSKARFVLLLSNGVDPYNGSTSVMNQGSPYVDNAIADVQRAGVSVYSIYFADAGIYGSSANFSGQDYLNHLTQATGGNNYWQGQGNPVSTAPFLSKFQSALAETYIANFLAPVGRGHDLADVKFSVIKPAKLPKSKVKAPKPEAPVVKINLQAPEKVHPGNAE